MVNFMLFHHNKKNTKAYLARFRSQYALVSQLKVWKEISTLSGYVYHNMLGLWSQKQRETERRDE